MPNKEELELNTEKKKERGRFGESNTCFYEMASFWLYVEVYQHILTYA